MDKLIAVKKHFSILTKYLKTLKKFLSTLKKLKKDKGILNNKYFVIIIVSLVSIVLLLLSNVVLATVFKMLKSLSSKSLKPINVGFKDLFNFEFRYKAYYFIVFFIIAVTDIKIINTLRTSFKSINMGQKGTSEFTTLKELKQQYRAVPEKAETYEGRGGVVISHYEDKLFIDDSPVNNLIIGTTRSGKGETFVFPTIDVYSRAEKKPSLIANDPKNELATASYETLKNRGYEVRILNLLDPENGMSYNPLQLIIDAYKNKDYSTAQLLCNTLTFSMYHEPDAKDKYFNQSAQSLVNALILAITRDCIESNQEEKITLYTVANFLSEMGSKVDEKGNSELDNFFARRDSSDIAKMQYATVQFTRGLTRAGVLSTAMTKLQMFTFDSIAKMTSKNSCNLEDIGFGEKPIAIFMVTPDFDGSCHVITSIFVRQIYFALSKRASLSRDRKCEREVVFMLDEFGSMPPIENMSSIITVCLGRNMRFNLIIQSYEQLKTLYANASSTIIENCGNQIYILTINPDTAKKFSELIGYKTLVSYSRNGRGTSIDKSLTESVDRRALLDSNELMSLKEGESVVVRVTKRRDIKGNKIRAKPIYNTGETSLKFRYEYLQKEFDTDKSIADLDILSDHKNTELKKLIFNPITNESKDSNESKDKKKNKDKENSTKEKQVEESQAEEKQLTKQEKFLIGKITSRYEELEDIDIENSNQEEIYMILNEYKSCFSNEDKKALEKVLGRSF